MLQRNITYIVVFFLSFLLFLYITFDWDAAKERIEQSIPKNIPAEITIARISPSWFTGLVLPRPSH